MNGGCKIHGPAVLADQLGLGLPMGNTSVPASGSPLEGHCGRVGGSCTGGFKTRFCPEVIRAFDGVRFIAENTRREEESVKVSEDSTYS